jgi:dynein heavy chain
MINNFKKRLVEYDVDHISEPILRKIKKYIDKPDFNPIEIGKKAKAAECLAKWCIALEKYANIRKKVIPIEIELEKMNKEYSEAEEKLNKKQAELKKIIDYVNKLKNDFDETNK